MIRSITTFSITAPRMTTLGITIKITKLSITTPRMTTGLSITIKTRDSAKMILSIMPLLVMLSVVMLIVSLLLLC
jgi:hypothetical protein